MKIFDCFMYFDEDLILDIRLNTLDKVVDYFVIVESTSTHSGEKNELKFDIKKYKDFKDKIIYLIYENIPKEIVNLDTIINEKHKEYNKIMNAVYRENSHRNYISEGLRNASNEDIIMISDIDEIPNLEEKTFSNINKKILMFQQDMFYYKFNLKLPNTKWVGTKACKFKNFKNPQWLRNVKDRKYKFYRLDTLFSETKYQSIEVKKNGGWHFTNIKTAEEIKHKLNSYLHHNEFEKSSLDIEDIQDIISNQKTIYNLKADKRVYKIGEGEKLEKIEVSHLPNYIKNNEHKYKKWIQE